MFRLFLCVIGLKLVQKLYRYRLFWLVMVGLWLYLLVNVLWSYISIVLISKLICIVGRLPLLLICQMDHCIIYFLMEELLLNVGMLQRFILVFQMVFILIFSLLECRYIIQCWIFRDDFTRILSIFLTLFCTIFYLCICSLFLDIFLFLQVVLFGKMSVFQIVVCRFKLKLLQWLLGLLIFVCFYCNALVLQFAWNKFDNSFEEYILYNKLGLCWISNV